MKILYLIVFFIFGCENWCDDADCYRKAEFRDSQKIVSTMPYVKDSRTGLCFAVWVRAPAAGVITVPCEKVQNELNK